MRLYLAGKRTGLPDYNRALFATTTAALRAAGHHVISPTELDGADEGMTPGSDGAPLPEDVYLRGLRKCVAAMLSCSAVAVLDGWEDSRGAVLEVGTARALGMPVFRVVKGEFGPGVHIAWQPAPVDPAERDESVLEEAERLVSGERAARYGHPADFGARVAGAWQAAFGWDATAHRVQLAMVLFKTIRADMSPEHRDSLTDIGGYSRSAEAVQARAGVPGFLDLEGPRGGS